jgi:hypothetical protein
MTERRIPVADISGWVSEAQNDVPTFQLMTKAGSTIYLQDPKGELKNVLSTLSEDFVNLDEILESSGRFHVDERLGRFGYSDGAWHLSAKVDLPFQADVPIGFMLEIDTLQFPELMPKGVIWIQDNLAEIWNAAARFVNAVVEAEGIRSVSFSGIFGRIFPMQHWMRPSGNSQ